MAHCHVIDRVLDHTATSPVYYAELQRLRALAGSPDIESDLGGDDGRSASTALHPLAVAYVILGSRLGARLIARRISPGEREDPSAAVLFLTDEGSAGAWRQLRLDLAAISSADEAENICRDAEAVFRLYHDAAEAMKPDLLRGAA